MRLSRRRKRIAKKKILYWWGGAKVVPEPASIPVVLVSDRFNADEFKVSE